MVSAKKQARKTAVTNNIDGYLRTKPDRKPKLLKVNFSKKKKEMIKKRSPKELNLLEPLKPAPRGKEGELGNKRNAKKKP